MDSDTANLRKVVAKKVDGIIDLAIVDIFNSKRKSGKIADPESNSSFIDEIRASWLRLTDEEKACLTTAIKEKNKAKKNVAYNVTSKELVIYFVKYILPYEKHKEESGKTKSFTQMLIWSNEVINKLKEIELIEQELEKNKGNISRFYIENQHGNYENAVNNFFKTYGNPTENEKRILKLKLMFSKKIDLLKHLLKERNTWQEILDNTRIS